VHGSAAAGKPGGGLDEIGAGLFGEQAGDGLLLVGQQHGLDDDLDDRAARVGGGDHAANIALHQVKVAGFERANVNHHVDFGRAVVDGAEGFKHLHVGRGGPEREANDGADLDRRAVEQLRAQFHPAGVDAHRGEVVLARFIA